MKYFKLLLFVFTLLFILPNSQAQIEKQRCGTDEHTSYLRNQDASLILKAQDLENYIESFKQIYNPSTQRLVNVIIPVVVHNITHDGGQGYVSKQDIEAQINTLNEEYQRIQASASQTRAVWLPYVSTMNIEFRLAHIDPNGDCTEGIVRMESPYSLSTSTNMAENVKSVSIWPTQGARAYFNIWVIDQIEVDAQSGTYVAGYAQFPGSNNNGTYGVVMVDQNFGAGNSTLTHELGHCFDLLHTFNYGSCNGGGDQCSDTPKVYESNFNCDPNRNTCTNFESFFGGDPIDQWENYMSYANCQNMFSLQQETRVMAIINNTNTNQGVAHLSNAGNLAATGTDNPYNPPICAPIADFEYTPGDGYICEGATVNFTDESYNAAATGWNWLFTGGTPNTSPVQNPTITYNTAGIYSVTHQPSTTAGTGNMTKTSIITVSSLVADFTGPIIDGYENTTQFNNDWINVSGTDNYEWENTTNAAATGSRSIYISNFFTPTSASDVDFVISPSYDLSSSLDKTVTFKVAFAKKNSNSVDRLLVYYSLDCGETWQLKLPLTTNNLVTAPDHGNVFVPTSSEWVTKSMNFTAQGGATNIRFKFEFEGGGGNNIYIDDLNIGGVTGVDEYDNIGSFNVYPNPTSSSATLSFSLTKAVDRLSVRIRNLLGQEVTNVINGQSFQAGKYTLNIDEEMKLTSGVYLIEFNTNNKSKTIKLIIQ